MAISTNLGAFDRDRYEQEMYYRQRNAMLRQQMNSRYDIERDCFIDQARPQAKMQISQYPTEAPQPPVTLLLL